MSNDHMLAGLSGLWVQPDGPNTALVYLGCHEVMDVTRPRGSKQTAQCPDVQTGEFKVVLSWKDEPGQVTATIRTRMREVANYLEKLSDEQCAFPFYINKVKSGFRNMFANRERSFPLYPAEITSESLSGLASMEEADVTPSEAAYDVEADAMFRSRMLTAARQLIGESEGLNDIAFCNVPACAGGGAVSKPAGTDGIIGSDAPAGSPSWDADLWHTDRAGDAETDGTSGWTATAQDPFGPGEDIISLECFQAGKDVIRWLIAREADAANPMEVRYSDDDGVTWTTVVVGSTNDQGATTEGSLFVLDYHHIWLAAGLGYVYFSDDGGASWATQTAGGVTAQLLNAVHFADENDGMAVGAADAVIVTTDGGTTWTLATATGSTDALLCVSENAGGGYWWAGTDGGELYYSGDQGTTWTARTFPDSGVGAVRSVDFYDHLKGAIAHDDAGPVGHVFHTICGGTLWEEINTPTNVGFTAVKVIGWNLIYAVGNVSGVGGVVLKLSG